MSWEDVLPLALAAGLLQTFSTVVNLPVNLDYCKCRQIPEITITAFQTLGPHEKINAKAEELTLEHLESLLLPEELTQHAELLRSFGVLSKQSRG